MSDATRQGMHVGRPAFGGLSVRGIVCCVLVAAVTFVWPVVGTIALRNVLLAALLLLLLTDRAVHGRMSAVLRDLGVPVVLLLTLTAWIAIHNQMLSQYPSHSHDEFRGQWLKPLLIFCIGILLAARCRAEPGLLTALLKTIKWTLVAQVTVVIGDLFYLWVRDIHLPQSTVRLTGTRTSISYSVLLILSIMSTEWMRAAARRTRAASRNRRLQDIAVVAISLSCLVLIGSRYGIVLSLGLLALVAASIAWRHLRSGSTKHAILLLALTAVTTAVVLYGAVHFDPRWIPMVKSARLVFAPGHEHDWRLFSDANPPLFDNGRPVEASAFLRVARFRAGVDLIVERPLGWGFGRAAMEQVVMLRYHTAQIASDSGLVDWTLAVGIPGTLLWLGFGAALLRIGWRTRDDATSAAPLLLIVVVAIFMVRFMVDINTRDHMFETFLFLCGLLGGAVPRRPPEAAGR